MSVDNPWAFAPLSAVTAFRTAQMPYCLRHGLPKADINQLTRLLRLSEIHPSLATTMILLPDDLDSDSKKSEQKSHVPVQPEQQVRFSTPILAVPASTYPFY